MHLRNLLRSIIFFPVLVSTVAVGITFAVLMHPSTGLINQALEVGGIDGPAWLTDPDARACCRSRSSTSGRASASRWSSSSPASCRSPRSTIDAVELEGGAWVQFRHVILPLTRNATFTVILLSFIGGLRTFDLIWTMTRGGPGFTTDVITSTIYKQYQAGFYGLSTAGNVILFFVVHDHRLPADALLQPAGDRAVRRARSRRGFWIGSASSRCLARRGRVRRSRSSSSS